MIKRAFAYVTRKKLKSLIILFVVLVMTALSLVSLSIKDATDKAAKETYSSITNSFMIEINRRVNQGTPRGSGNVRGIDIKKIADSKDIVDYVKRINIVADLDNYDIIETSRTLSNLSPDRAKKFKRSVMMTGVNNSEKETKFVSGAYKLVSGRHIKNGDKNKILMHKDLAEKNNLKVGDKIKLKSNIYDADNEKGANETIEVEILGLFDGHNKSNETIEVEILGLFDGHNKSGVTYAQELYENTLVSDIDTAVRLYGYTEDTAVYQDASFFVKGDKNIDQVLRDIKKLDINWQKYNLIKSSSNFPALQKSISGIYGIADQLFIGSLVFAGVIVALLLFLWMNARRREIAILLAVGISKVKILTQFLFELVFITIPAFIGSYFLAGGIGKAVGNNILKNVTSGITKQMMKESSSIGMGGGAEVDGFNKTLTSLDVDVNGKLFIYAVIFMLVVLCISLLIASINILRKEPKELLSDEN